jgi:aspartyl-tRNA synthetase
MLHRYPLNARPFYTMPAPDDARYTNSFDIFIRGEEIISGARASPLLSAAAGSNQLSGQIRDACCGDSAGAQRIHVPELLEERAKACGIPVETLASYIESFTFGALPHGACAPCVPSRACSRR